LDSYALDVDVGGSEKSSSFQIGEHQAEKKKIFLARAEHLLHERRKNKIYIG
jgi:hypothetical protein